MYDQDCQIITYSETGALVVYDDSLQLTGLVFFVVGRFVLFLLMRVQL